MTNMWQLCLKHSSCDQPCPAVTINDLFPGVTVTINSPKCSTPKIFNIRPAVTVSHDRKNNRSHDSFQAQYGLRKRCRVDTIREYLNSPYSASVILLIVTALDCNCYLPYVVFSMVRIFSKHWYHHLHCFFECRTHIIDLPHNYHKIISASLPGMIDYGYMLYTFREGFNKWWVKSL